MSFFKEPERPRRASKFLRITTGVPVTVIIMDDNPTPQPKHWITDGAGKRLGLNCPGERICPICLTNQRIGYNKKHPDFISLQRRYAVNVLDVTPVKRCPTCEAPHRADFEGDTCSIEGCNTSLADVEAEPLLKVKILERGRTLMGQISALETIPHPFSGKVMKLNEFPIMLMATGSGTEMVITAIPQAPMDVNLDEYERHDFSELLVLTPEEISHLLEGGTFRDVMAARNAAAETTVDAKEEIPF